MALVAALVLVLVISQKYDPTNPHSTVDKNESDIQCSRACGTEQSEPAKQCYTCHVKKGLGGEEFCTTCHVKFDIQVNLPKF